MTEYATAYCNLVEMHMFPSQLQKRWQRFRALRSGRLLHAYVLLAKPRRDHPLLSQLSQDRLPNQLRSSGAKPQS